MKKISLMTTLLIAVCCLVPSLSCAERPVKVYAVGPGGELVEKEPPGGMPADQASAKGLQKTDPNAAVFVIEDFEDGDNKNLVQGDSGEWNLTPYEEDVGITIDRTSEPGANGSKYALKLTYDVDGKEIAKLGFWTKLMSYDATQFDHLAFDVRGDREAGFTTTFLIELKKYKNEERIDKIKGTYVFSGVTGEWQTVQIPLNMFTGLFDQTNPEVWRSPMIARRDLDELVINIESSRVSAKAGVLYFDNFKFVRTGEPGEHIIDQPERAGTKTPVRLEGAAYAKFLRHRLGGYPKEVNPDVTFPEEDAPFLQMIARDTWRFFDEIVDRENHLPLDTIQLGLRFPLADDGFVGDYTNVTNIGLYLMCLVSAYDLGFIPHEEAVRRIQATLSVVESLEHHESGFLYNYYDTTTRERTSYFISLVDSGWLDAGIYVVKNAFPDELSGQADRLLGKHNFSFFYDPVEQQMTHGYYAHLKVHSDYHYGSYYTEPRAASYIAIGRGDVPLEHWFQLIRTFPEEYPWQTQMPIDRNKRTTLGFTYYGGYYQWKDLKFVPSWGGSMFEALMPTLIMDEAKYSPESLGRNNKNHVLGHIRYALEDLGYPVWGMSPSSVPEGGYSEYGVKPLGAKGYKAGVVTPHAAFLALEYAPREAVRNLRTLLRLYPIYGEYGFYDAVAVETGLVARKYLALDQAMILIALNNYLTDGAIRKRFHADPINQKALALLTEERLFGADQKSGA